MIDPRSTKPMPAEQHPAPFDPHDYWTGLVSGDMTLDKVGNVRCSVALNQWIYRQKFEALRAALRKADLDLTGADVFEAAIGTGYYLDRWPSFGVRTVVGVDLSPDAVEAARRRFPDVELAVADLTALDSPTSQFDLVTAIDVLYHIIDDAGWERAVADLAARVKPGGALLFTDQFVDERTQVQRHVRRRTADDYTAILGDDFEAMQRSVFTRWLGHGGSGIAFQVWRFAYRVDRLANRIKLGRPVGSLIGRGLKALEDRRPPAVGVDHCLEIVIAQRRR